MRDHNSRTTELGVGDRLDRYRLEALLGRGAMGVVFRAVREPDGETVALKLLKRALSESDIFTRRFLREARIAEEVEHPNLVPILEAGEFDGRHYLAMAYVAGPSLEVRLREEGRLSLEDVLRVVADVAAGLDALHARGLIHRDVKPSNILISADGTAALTDFGLATGPAYTVLTRPGQLLGTPDYLAPEVIRGEGARPATDIYALGCVAFACVAGAPPFASENVFEVTIAHLEKDPPDPCAGRSDVPPGLSEAVLRALAKDPLARPGTAKAYALGLWRAARPS